MGSCWSKYNPFHHNVSIAISWSVQVGAVMCLTFHRDQVCSVKWPPTMQLLSTV